MTPVMPCSISEISHIPGPAFRTRKNNYLRRCHLSRKPIKLTPSTQKFPLPFSTSIKLFPQYSTGCSLHHISGIHRLSATGTDVTVEESDSPIAGEGSGEAAEAPSGAHGSGESSSNESSAISTAARSRRSRPVRKSEMPPVKNEELVPGATFTGKVRSIQPFGAFIDIGAFTEGLVHVSRLSDTYVKDVGSFVSVGQEVKVRLIEANTETGRISLTMRERDDTSNLGRQNDGPASSDKAGPATRTVSKPSHKKGEVRKSSKFVKGQDLEGTVKNMTRAGAFISLPEGEEGFLPISEEADEGFGNVLGNSSLQVGQEVSVRVLRISRGRVTLTMKKEEDVQKLNSQLTQGVIHTATNPFVLAFSKSKEIAAFLDERKRLEKEAEKPAITTTSKELEEKVNQSKTGSNEVQDQVADNNERTVSVPSTEEADNEASPQEAGVGATALYDASTNIVEKVDGLAASSPENIDTVSEEADMNSEILAPKESIFTATGINKDASITGGVEGDGKSDLLVETNDEGSSREVDLVAKMLDDASTNVADNAKDQESSITSLTAGAQEVDLLANTLDDVSTNVVGDEKDQEGTITSLTAGSGVLSSLTPVADNAVQTIEKEVEMSAAEEVDLVAIMLDDVSTYVADDEKDQESIISSSIAGADDAVQTIEKEEDVSSRNEVNLLASTLNEASTNAVDDEKDQESTISSATLGADGIIQTIEKEAEVSSAINIAPSAQNKPPTGVLMENNEVESNSVKDGSTISSGLQPNDSSAQESKDGEENDGISDASGKLARDQVLSHESQAIEEVVENVFGNTEDGVQIQVPAAESEIPSALRVEDEKVEAGLEKNSALTNSNGQTDSSFPKESTTKATISPVLVKQLREETGAGMMDCKKALSETKGDIVKAQEVLRKKGLASAETKASRTTAEGRIGSYIHDSRIGVLVEVNCETDFVSRGDIFKELVDDLAMQVAACPQVQYLITEDVPEDIVDKEREIEMQKEDLLSKPEQIRSKIVEGRIEKRLKEMALLEQPYIKSDKILVKDWVKQTIATIGENIKVKRFVRYSLGEGLEKKSQDFAAEVAAQTAAKAEPKAEKERPAIVEANETVQKPPTATVSAALVKQLREETGAGMMDCKKALSETGGDLEKAQEYLRKKGLSAADKKSSRLAAEGRIGSYIHDSRIGVLIEVNCETDFVGRSEKFRELVDDLAMQVVACPQVQFVSIEDVPESIVNREKELEMQREDILSKPENIRERIVEGRISKRLGELALLEQPFVKDDSIFVRDLVKQTVAAIGENIKVRRFVRFTLGCSNRT